MENNIHMHEDRDPKLWEIAKRRASFKSNLITYLIVNAFLWGLWYFTGARTYYGSWPWPVWPTAGWGIGLIFHYFGAYIYPEANSVEREYDNLKRKQG